MADDAAVSLATVNMLLAGYAHALQRLQDAIAAKDRDATFRAVFELLNWACSIEDRIREHWAPEGQPLNWAWRGRVHGGELMAGVRFARNRVHHHWVDAIYFNESGGMTFPMTFPAYFSTWRWRALADLPRGRDDSGADVYVQHLERQPVEKTLLQLGLVFEQVGLFLEPPRPTPGNSFS